MTKIIIILLFTFNGLAQTRILNFNTMCDICSGSNLATFSTRLTQIQKVLIKYPADLISLQELRNQSHVKFLFKKLPHYETLPKENELDYTDSVIAFNKKKYQLINSSYFWLGPAPDKFNFGWKTALPRFAVWAHLKEKATGLEFIFLGSHFDNLRKNLNGSAKLISKFINSSLLPVIFAADTNITSDMPAYKTMAKTLDSKLLVDSPKTVIGEKKSDKEICYRRKGDVYPQCRVEHILFSKNSPWKVIDFYIHTAESFLGRLSDHSAFYVEIEADSKF